MEPGSAAPHPGGPLERHIPELNELVTTTAAGLYLGLARQVVNGLILTGGLPAQRHDQRWLIRRDDLEAFAATHQPGNRAGAQAPAASAALDRALATIAEDPGITVAGLALATGEPRRTALGRAQALEQRGLITRTRGGRRPSDPDQCRLTAAGCDAYHRQTSESRSA